MEHNYNQTKILSQDLVLLMPSEVKEELNYWGKNNGLRPEDMIYEIRPEDELWKMPGPTTGISGHTTRPKSGQNMDVWSAQ